MEIKEAIDILQNSIADYVIGEYCEKCGDRLICEDRNEDCYFLQAIDTILNHIDKIQKGNKEIEKTLEQTQNSWFKDTKTIDKLQKELKLKDKVIDNLYADIEYEYSGTNYLKSLEEYYEESDIE